MRLHHLEITAFGPFAEPVSVDFDQLSDAGLFLLSGATGAGKTSVLDAVCFALFGDVPGDRGSAKRLRSDQAAPGARPRVSMEATLAGRRFRIIRSPAWERPKKRGTGLTTEQASVSIAERVDGAWVTLSSRLDETGHLVTRLVGMNVAQFTQVAMLPQGQFQAFLRARSEERHRLLQQLFRTGRFEHVERWLRDHRVALRRTSDTTHQEVADLVSRVSEATGEPLPDGWDAHDLTGPAAEGSILSWAIGLGAHAADAHDIATAEAAGAEDRERAARTQLDEARRLAERHARYDAARAEKTAIEAQVDAHDHDRRTFDAARRAAAVAPVHRIATTARAARDRATLEADRTGTLAAAELGLPNCDRESLDRAVITAEDAAGAVRAALPREAALDQLSAEIATAERRAADLGERLGATAAARDALPARISELEQHQDAARAAQTATASLESLISGLIERIEAGTRAVTLERQLTAARADLSAARETALRRWEELLDLRQARLDGMAAEIACALAVGASCPVCGSADHPHKATPAPGAPDAAAEKATLKVLDDAKATEHAHEEKVRDLATRLAVAHDQAGNEPPQALRAQRASAESELTGLRATAAEAGPLADALTASRSELARLTDELGRLEVHSGEVVTLLRHRVEQAEELREQIGLLLDGTGLSTLDELLERHLFRAGVAREACAALHGLATAEAALTDAETALELAADEAGFASPREAVTATRTSDEVDELAVRVREHERRIAAVEAVLAELGPEDLTHRQVPDLPALTASHADALSTVGDCQSRAARWSHQVARVDRLAVDLAEVLARWAPLRQELELATYVSAFVDGKAADNRLQMRLSAYVLAYRLGQVVDAANERLAGMSDQRYSLEHTGRRGAGETRGGLSLLVRDDWSGESRDPATLSGGETFVVSLALALGLADVITQEAGGADLDTLFVDEGFGSLDADTLDDVMDTLDSLRDGGRVVGVVSHVAEMRDRIPTQLVVTKSRKGSTLAVSR